MSNTKKIILGIGIGCGGIIVVMFIAVILIIAEYIEMNRMEQCPKNMNQIMMAMHTYHHAEKSFPTSSTLDENGKPLHSWRVALLPYIDIPLYEQIRHNEPWDSQWNKQFHNKCPNVYQCPSTQKTGMTNYSVVVGKADAEQAQKLGLRGPCSTAFPEPNKWMSMSDINNGISGTIGIVERKIPVCWMDPTQEITQEEAIKLFRTKQSKIGSAHKDGFHAGFLDGHVEFLSLSTLSIEDLKNRLTAKD